MADNTILTTSTSNAINLSNSNISLNVSANVNDEKSVFERAIIEAFKKKQSKQIYDRLAIALDEIKFIVNEIKSSSSSLELNSINCPGIELSTGSANIKKYLLNKNIIDKLSRIIERKFFNVNILVAKIFENLLDPNNFEILSADIDLLVNLANEVLNLLESIKSTIVSRQLEKKCSNFLNYLSSLTGINEEQKVIINELIQSFPLRNSSNTYKNFDQIRDKIIQLCRMQTVEDKMDGINTLMDSFGATSSLEEQFDLLLDKVPAIVKGIIHQPNPEFKEAYFQLGNFICSMLFATKFKVDAFLPEYKINNKDLNKNYFFFFAGDDLVDEYTKDEISFLHSTIYELTYQKEILTRCENIFQICNLIVNTLSVYDTIFDLQFVCYIILKRIYFTFPQFRKNIEDNLAVTLVNLCTFTENFERENSEECRMLIKYLLEKGDDDLRHKIKKRVEARSVNIDIKQELNEIDIEDVEFEQLKLSDFNLRIGYPSSYEVEAGGEMSKYIEVHYANSLIYVGFATQSNDITLHLLKYVPNDETEIKKAAPKKDDEDDDDSDEESPQEVSEEYTDKGHFKVLLKLERIDSSMTPVKIVFFVPEPGTYKLIFDNTYSWFTSKTMRHRFSVLKPLSVIDLDRKVDFSKMKRDMRGNIIQEKSDNKLPQKIEKNYPYSNKMLMVKFEGQNRTYNLGKIHQDQQFMKENLNYIAIPILLTSNSIRIIREVTDEHGQKKEDIKEVIVENKLESEGEVKPYSLLLEEELITYLNSVNELEQKTVFLNSFILEKKLTLPETDASTLPITDDEDYREIFTKLGFYPEKLIEKFENVRLFCHSLADSCLLYLLYEKILLDQKFNNIIYIHIDKYKSQASLYFDGVIHDKISGFKFDEEKSLIENIDNIIEFINKVSVIFGAFDLCVSYTDLDDK